MPLLRVKLRRITAIIQIDSKKYKVIRCSNSEFCRKSGILNCPPYCEVIVAAKDYFYGRRKPKAQVEEIKEDDLLIEV